MIKEDGVCVGGGGGAKGGGGDVMICDFTLDKHTAVQDILSN